MVGEHLLLVDDVDIVSLMKSILSEEDYSIDESYDGESTVGMVEPEKYSLILLEFVLPGIKGDAVAERMSALDSQIIHHMLTNLIINGVQTMPSGGSLTNDAVEVDDFMRVCMKDIVTCISPEMIDELFTPPSSQRRRKAPA